MEFLHNLSVWRFSTLLFEMFSGSWMTFLCLRSHKIWDARLNVILLLQVSLRYCYCVQWQNDSFFCCREVITDLISMDLVLMLVCMLIGAAAVLALEWYLLQRYLLSQPEVEPPKLPFNISAPFCLPKVQVAYIWRNLSDFRMSRLIKSTQSALLKMIFLSSSIS